MYVTEEIVNLLFYYLNKVRQDVLHWTKLYVDDKDSHSIITSLSKNVDCKCLQNKLDIIKLK